MANRFINPSVQHFDIDNNAPLIGGKMFFYEAGTDDPKNTFITQNENGSKNTNPVILDGMGFQPPIFGNGSYDIVLKSSSGVEQWSRSDVDLDTTIGEFSIWDSQLLYPIGSIVEGSDQFFYISIADENINKDPSNISNSDFWSRLDTLNRWNQNEIYLLGDPVRGENGIIYTAAQDNTGNNPATDDDAVYWKMFDNIRIDGNEISSTDTDGDINLIPNGDGHVTIGGTDIYNVTTQTFYSSGTWVKPEGVKHIMVEMVAGGGGGGSASTGDANKTNAGGQGGGAGEYVRFFLEVYGVTSKDVVVGEGGNGGVAGLDGDDGEDTAFDSPNYTASSGLGGKSLNRAVADSFRSENGGSGGSGGGIRTPGGDGEMGKMPDNLATSDRYIMGGRGGSSYFGSGGSGPLIYADISFTVVEIDGSDGRSYGSGGSGAASFYSGFFTGTGGRGSDGVVVITEFR